MNNLVKSVILTPLNILYKISPKAVMKILFRLKQGYSLDLDKPKTYNEKLQWIKLNDKNVLMPKCCDKYIVRSYIEEQGFSEILNRLIWSGFNPEEIPFDELPNQFVIKVTHGSTFNIICHDKHQLSQQEVIKKCKKWLKSQFLPCYGEWFYGIEPPRIIVEDYIASDDNAPLKDYKVFCFNGKPKYVRIDADRFTDHKSAIYDCDWNLIPGANMGFKCSDESYEKPECLELMLEYAAKLSKPFLHARVDFYIVHNKIIFGEITFTNGAGFDKFSSYEFDLEMGSHLNLYK